jgi:DNA-directed RNA polymerase specialized sigma24 family protein
MKHKKVQMPLNMDQESFSYEEAELFWELVPSNLTEEEELLIKLRLDGFNFKEISMRLECHRSRTKKIYNNAIQKIRDHNAS